MSTPSDPGSPAATAAEVRELLATRGPAAAIGPAARLLEGTPPAERAEPATLLALVFLRDGDSATAERLLPGPEADGAPDAPVLLAELLAARLARSDLDGAHGLGLRLADRVATMGPPVARAAAVDALVELGVALTEAGRGSQAIPLQQATIDALAGDGSIGARRCRSGLWIGLARNLTRLGRADVVRRIGEQAFTTFAEDPDRPTRENALVAGCLAAQAALALGAPDDALDLAERIAVHIPDDDPRTPELQARVGLVVAAAQLELNGSQVAETTYRRVVTALRPVEDPGARLFLALALEMVAAMPADPDRRADAATAARELAEVIERFPPTHPDFSAVAECGNRAAERLIPFGAPRVAADLAAAVTERRDVLLAGDDAAICLRAYIFRLDALRLLGDGEGLERAWQEVLELGDAALEVLDGLAARYRQDGLRAAHAYTELGRVAVLARLGRESDARRAVRAILVEFGDDEDTEVQSIVARLRPPRPSDPDGLD